VREFDCFGRLARRRDDIRRTGRVRIEASLQCSVGRVLDLSNGGVRVLARRAPSTRLLPIRLWDDSAGLVTEARVIWHIRRGFFRHELGLELPPLDDAGRAFLTRIAARHRWTQTLNDFDIRNDAA